MAHPYRFRSLLLVAGLWLWSTLGLEAGCAQAQNVQALEASAPLAVRSAYTELVEGVYLLSARLHIPIDERLRELLGDGVAMQLEIEIKVVRPRSYWLDDDLAALTQRYQLRYHAVSDRYLVRNLNSGEHQTFPSLEDAMRELTSVQRLPLLDRALVQEDRHYLGLIRAVIDVGDAPAALRWLKFWADKGRRESDWYTWRVLQ